MGGEFFTDFKSSNGIKISRLVQVLSNFKWFRGSTPLGGWRMGGWRWVLVRGCGGVSHAHTHACTCTHMHARMHMHVKHAKHAKHGCLHDGGHLQFLYMSKCACVRVHACACVCVCVWGHPPCPQMPPHPPGPSPEPQGAQNTKIQ